MEAQQEVRKLLDQIRVIAPSPVVDKCTNAIEALCMAHMAPEIPNLVSKLNLTPTQAIVFGLLHKKLGQIVRHESIIQAIWFLDNAPECAVNSVKVHIHHIRPKIKPHGFDIKNYHGIGYSLTECPST